MFANDASETTQRMAETLVQELRADRQFADALRRPMIFICHGMGGVLVKKSLVYASTRTAPKVAHLWDHYISTFAILFFGTPHGHADKSSWLEYEAIAKASRHPAAQPNVRVKSTDRGDPRMPFLIDNDFAPLVKQFHLFFFWEELATRFNGRSAFLVDYKSAAPTLDNTEAAGIHATHSDMCKFGSRTSSDYRTVIAALATYCQKAPRIISGRWRQAEDALKRLRIGEAEEIGGIGFDVHLEQPFRSLRIRSHEMLHFHPPEETSHSFIGRQDLLRNMRNAFFPSDRATTISGSKSFVIFGMGGSGKTELCTKFANDNKHRYTAVFTIRAASSETITESYCGIGLLAGLQPTESAGRHFLSQQIEPWLLIIDNADDQSLNLRRLFPPGGTAHILVTTRVRDFRQEGTIGSFELKGLKEPEALQLLLTRADIPRPWDASTTITGSRIAKALGYLALALIQAGTCVYRGVCELGDYLDILSSAKRQLQNQEIRDVMKVVYSTFDISLGHLSRTTGVESQDASDLLRIIAFYHFEFVPLELFSRAVTKLDNALSTARSKSRSSSAADGVLGRFKPPATLPNFLKVKNRKAAEHRIKVAFANLQSHSFIRYDGRAISMHPLIHSWARDSLTPPQKHIWASIAFNILMESISLPPMGDTRTDGGYHNDIIPHLEACLSATGNPLPQAIRDMGQVRLRVFGLLQPTFLLILREQIEMHAKCGWVFAERGHFEKAMAHLQIVREMLVKLRGMADEKTMSASLGLAGVCWGLGRMEEAIDLQRSVVEARSRIYGPQDARTLQAMDKLGRSYWLHGQYREALDLQQITSNRMKRILGEDHPETLEALDNLGVTLGAWYRFQESLEIHQFVLSARTTSLGEAHLDTLTTKGNLAMALLDLGRLEEAKAAMAEVHAQRQIQLGREHPWTLWALCYLAKIDIQLGLLAEAEEMLNWGIAAATRSLGRDHLGVLIGRGQLAQVYARTDRLDEAQKLSEETIRIVERSRGIAHPDCVYGLWKLARLYVLQGRREKAIQTCELGLQRADMRISRSHPLANDLGKLLDGLREPASTVTQLLDVKGNSSFPTLATPAADTTPMLMLGGKRKGRLANLSRPVGIERVSTW
ncbi:Nephrocystin-3 [Madurella mycetomatis]|uniref:Nephrocystin-3 n=1 Tax=Madurella mycetomatis TaxID=100816 RepID=A0A175VUE7_9PEZI|nr:Nephrocystin-3 [Madurella mycetomatis]KXX80372.1 Nephrocystin-3 [Madurella mycetomatis]